MVTHPVLPGISLQSGFIYPAFDIYLRGWREQAITDADNGIAAASICQQAIMIDLVLDGRPKHDWHSVMEDLLTEGDKPLAYSKGFGALLYKFDAQYLQSTVHSIHTRWWNEILTQSEKIDHEKFAGLILSKKGDDGLIYDINVSPTILRHRMKAELSLSALMGAEILFKAGALTQLLKNELATSLCDPRKVPPMGYMASEQFRLAALRILGHEEQFPTGIHEHIKACEVGLAHGWGDFSIASKIDAYMGTAKRTSRDKQIHSPVVACHVKELSKKVTDLELNTAIKGRLESYATYLSEKPLDIPAFQMRDVPIPFGADMTPIEAVCASHLIAHFSSGK
jgi:hypothetical protein